MDRQLRPHPLDLRARTALLGTRAAVGALGLVALSSRLWLGADVSRHRYGTGKQETLELIDPMVGAPARSPVVYVHGGGWIAGRKELYTRDLCFLAELGHPVFNLDYPLAPEHPHPTPLRGLLRALDFVARSGPRAERVHLIGDSAGGNLAMMLGLLLGSPALRDRVLGPEADAGLRLPRPLSVISLYGVLDRLSWIQDGFRSAEVMLHCYGGRGVFEHEVGPELAITPMDLPLATLDLPPCLIVTGTRDPLARSSRLAAEALDEAGASVRFEAFPGEVHGFFNMGWRPGSARLRDLMREFMHQIEAAPASAQT